VRVRVFPGDIIVQVWSSRNLLQQVLNAGHQALLSQGYYLDKQIPNPDQTFYEWVDTWKNFYTVLPNTLFDATTTANSLCVYVFVCCVCCVCCVCVCVCVMC
jgi:hypothetical protein